jgi:indolepyruvate ferredoxin oxidoreductase alpha subunit
VLPAFGRTAIIGFGPSWSTVGRPTAEALDLHGMGSSVVYPLPGRLVEFASRFDTVLVVEEGRPVAESALTLALADLGARTAVLGRRGGALPAVGTLHVSDLHRALEGDRAVDDRVPLWKEGGKQADEPYRSLFDAVALVRRRHGVGVATCVGTVIDIAGAPWHSVDLALSLGSATGSAGGMAEAGRRSLALIGDYGLLHSGLNAFGAAQQRGLPVLTVIVANGVSKRTGGQRSAFHPEEPHAIDLLGVLRSRGARHVRVIDGDTADAEGLAAAIEVELDRLPATIVIESGEGFHRSAVGVARPGSGDRGTS